MHTASLHISSALKRSGTYAKECGSMCTASLHISWVFKSSGTAIIKRKTFSYRDIFVNAFSMGEDQILCTGGDFVIR